MKIFYSLFSILWISLSLSAQENIYHTFCGAEEVNKELMELDPGFKDRIQKFNKELSVLAKSGRLQQVYKSDNGIYEIPVVVHVFHDGSPIGTQYNKTDEQIQSWIDATNKIYEGTAPGFDGPGTGGTRIPIRLVLAKRDMNCNPTSGIIRIDGSQLPDYVEYGVKRNGNNGVTESQLYNLSQWDRVFYYNIYVINKFDGNDASKGGLAGYAYYPGGSNDRTLMVSTIVKNTDTTLSHEFGHAMGLKHTFGDVSGNGGVCPPSTGDCTVDDDFVCDTEPTQSLLNTYPVPTNSDINPCTGTYYQGTQYNIMNYGYKLTRFTDGQGQRAIAHILAFRASHINSKGGEQPDDKKLIQPVKACVPTSIANPENEYQMGPANVTFGDMNYKSGGYNVDGFLFYIDNPAKCYADKATTSIPVGVETPLSISVNINDQNVKAYIDYNNDGVFDEVNELVFSKRIIKNTTETINVTPPSDVVVNSPLRMRVVADWVSENITACKNLLYGQAEDFAVTFTKTLDIDEPLKKENIKIFTHNKSIIIKSEQLLIKKVDVFDIYGKRLVSEEFSPNSLYEISQDKLLGATIVFLVIQSENGATYKEKVLVH
ncbi:M43 family zinc metalloprotease [Apibacter raozihei]|uniref:GEVED domain-containing protein n=1 Tax=Apibacter raozihei TaxID=2500547 RepID=UPI000FE38453|nr:GEVED domain-containing protein [Apibacter raozihei]